MSEQSEIKITPEMIEAGHLAFHEWMFRWDYLADGLPGDPEVCGLISSIFESMSKVEQIHVLTGESSNGTRKRHGISLRAQTYQGRLEAQTPDGEGPAPVEYQTDSAR